MDHELPIAHDSEAELQEAKRQCLDIGKTVMDVSRAQAKTLGPKASAVYAIVMFGKTLK